MVIQKFLDWLLAALLLYAALVQGNDSDPAYWVLLYGGGSVLLLASALGRQYPRAALLLMGAAAAGAVQSASGFVGYLKSGDLASISAKMSQAAPWIEPAREFLGALIVLGVTFYVYSRYKKL